MTMQGSLKKVTTNKKRVGLLDLGLGLLSLTVRIFSLTVGLCFRGERTWAIAI